MLARSDLGIWAVADGIGGQRDGEIAASRVVQELAGLESTGTGYMRMMEAARRVERLNAELFELCATAGPIGSTLVFLLAHEGHYACLWAGDSRAYRMRNNDLLAVTRDHSVVQQLVDDGLIVDAERRDHPNANIITRAVGAAPHLRLDHRFAEIKDEDIFVLCSDGLTSCLSDDEIVKHIASDDMEGSADRLIAATLRRGAPDNVSFVLIRAERSDAPSRTRKSVTLERRQSSAEWSSVA